MNCGQGKRQKLLPNKSSRNVTSGLYSLVLLWFIGTMEYYSAIKNNEIMPFPVTWRDLWRIHVDVWQKQYNTVK